MLFLTGFQNRLGYCYFYIFKIIHIVAMMFVRKPTRPSFIDKAGCTRQFESELSLRSFAQLFPVKSSLSSSMVFTPPLSSPVSGGQKPQGRRGNRHTRCSEPLRYKVGGPSRVYARFCEMEPP